MANAGNVNVNLTANPAGWIAGFNAAAKAAQGLVNATTVVSTTIGVTLGNALTQALTRLANFISQTVELGRQVRIQQAAFKAMADSVGQNADDIARKISNATGAMIDLTSSYSAMGRLLAQGLNVSQMENLAKTAKSLSILMGTDVTTAFNQLGTAVLSGNVRMLRQVGIYVDAERALQVYANSIGTSAAALTEAGRSQAIYNALIEQAKPKVEALKGALDPSIEAAKRFEVQWNNLRESIGVTADTMRTKMIEMLVQNWPRIETMLKGSVETFMQLARALVSGLAAAQPLADLILKTTNSVLAAVNSLPDEIVSFGVLGILLFGKFGVSKLGQIGAVIAGLTVLAGILVKLSNAAQSAIPAQEKINALLREQAAIQERLAGDDMPPLFGVPTDRAKASERAEMEARLKAIRIEISALQTLADGYTKIEDQRAARTTVVGGKDDGPDKVLPDVHAIQAADQSMNALTHAFDKGAITGSQLYASLMAVRDGLAPLEMKFPTVAAKVMELEKRMISLDETVLRNRLTENLHDLQHVLKLDPSTISGMERTRGELVKFLEVAQSRPKTDSTNDFIRTLQERIRVLDVDIRSATGALVENDTAMGEEGRAATSAAAQLESLNAAFAGGRGTLSDYADRLIALRDRLLDLGQSGPGIEAINAKIKEIQASLSQVTEELPGAVEAMRGRPEFTPEQISAKVSEAGTSGAMFKLQQFVRERQAFLLSEIPKTDQQVMDANLQILDAEIQQRLLRIQDGVFQEKEIRIKGVEAEASLIEQRASQAERMEAARLRRTMAQAKEYNDIWTGVVTTIAQEFQRLPTAFEGVMQLTRGIFQQMGQALEESFFQIMKGNLDDMDDLWKGFLDSLLRMIAQFLAEQVVKKFIGLFFDTPGTTGISLSGAQTDGGGISVSGVNLGSTGSSGADAGASVAGSIAVGAAIKAGGAWALQAGVNSGILSPGFATGLAKTFGFTAPTAAANAGIPAASVAAAQAAGQASAIGVSSVGLGAEALFPVGSTVATSAATQTATTATTTTAAAAAAPALAYVSAVAGPILIAALGAYMSAQNRKTFGTRRLAATTAEIGAFQEQLAAGNLSPGLLQLGVQSNQAFQQGFLAPGSDPRSGAGRDLLIADSMDITNPATLERLGRMYGEDAPAVQAMIEQNAAKIREAFALQTMAILGGQAVGLPVIMKNLGVAIGGESAETRDVSGQLKGEAGAILGQLGGFSDLDVVAQDSLMNLMATFEGNKGAMVELIKSVSEQLPGGLKLSNEEALKLLESGIALNAEWTKHNDAVAALSAQLLDATNGVGNMAAEAWQFAQTLAAGEIPAENLRGIFTGLAAEHGPAFTEALMAAVTQLGLSNEQARILLETLVGASEIEVVVPVSYEVRGDIPPGVEGGTTGAPTVPAASAPGSPDGRFYGGWAPGFGAGGFVAGGSPSHDSTLAWLAQDEFVVRNKVARRHAPALVHLNRTGRWPESGAKESDISVLREHSALLRENNRKMDTLIRAVQTRNRMTGSPVA